MYKTHNINQSDPMKLDESINLIEFIDSLLLTDESILKPSCFSNSDVLPSESIHSLDISEIEGHESDNIDSCSENQNESFWLESMNSLSGKFTDLSWSKDRSEIHEDPPWAKTLDFDEENNNLYSSDKKLLEKRNNSSQQIYDSEWLEEEDSIMGYDNSYEIVPVQNPDTFTLIYYIEAIKIITTVSKYLDKYESFRDVVKDLYPIMLPEFTLSFEQKLAMYIGSGLRDKIQEGPHKIIVDKGYIVMKVDALEQITRLIQCVLQIQGSTFPRENTIHHLLDGYPIQLLSKVCGTNLYNAHIIGESMRRFVEFNNIHYTEHKCNWFPSELQSSTVSNLPLTGNIHSPINEQELGALFRYLGTRRRIYVTMLLNCLHELASHEKILFSTCMTTEAIINLCESSWLHLFLFAAKRNIFRKIYRK